MSVVLRFRYSHSEYDLQLFKISLQISHIWTIVRFDFTSSWTESLVICPIFLCILHCFYWIRVSLNFIRNSIQVNLPVTAATLLYCSVQQFVSFITMILALPALLYYQQNILHYSCYFFSIKCYFSLMANSRILENFGLDLFHIKVRSSVFKRVMFILITAIQYRLETSVLLSLASLCIFESLVLPLATDDLFMHPFLNIRMLAIT